ncbi:MAG: ABC transporter ATP-binding protein/permease [Gemmatimonadota bacterium]|nr:ABC transporter ATP-binding protein/permease [Gemmatimonadota bacterium]
MADSPATPPKKAKPPFKTVWKEARQLIWRHRTQVALGLVIMLVDRLAGFVLPVSSKFLIDNVMAQHQSQLLWPLAAAVGAATLVQAVTTFALSQVMSVAAQRAIVDMRREIQRKVLRLPISYFDSTKTGILITRIMEDAEGIRNLIGTGLVQLVGGVVTAVIALSVLFYINWHLTSLTLLFLGAFGGAMAYAFTKLRPVFRERSKINAEVTGRLAETLGGVRIVKVYTAERREQKVFAVGVHKLFRNIAKTITGVSAITSFTSVVVGGVGILIMVVGGRAVLDGRMTTGDFFLYIFLIGLVSFPLIQIASIGTQISEAFAGLDRIREVMAMSSEDETDAEREGVEDIRGDVRFDNVSFEYNPGVPVLKGVTFHAPAGSTTALVGSSGSGKSTLISLVMAFNHPKSGMIKVDGRDIETLRMRDYRAHLGVVLQDNFLFDGTIADNIRFAKPGATIEEVIAVSKIAHCDEFIDQFTDKYETIVGERGVKLSGGQRQRVAIARAILADPRVLILDEATSSLDSESEAKIRDGLRTLRRGRTTFVIAHRLSTIRSANQILVLEHGEIVERGTHSELMAIGGRYRDLYDRQHNVEEDQYINPGEDFTPEPEAVISRSRAGTGAPRAL